jgi:DNA-binding transcriptional ArsR family regulator
MRGQGILRYLEKTGEITRGDTTGFVLHEKAERLQSGRLREGGKGKDGMFIFHISRYADKSRSRQVVISNILEIPFDSRNGRDDLPVMKIDDAAARLEALGNPTRLKIYRALVRAGQAGMAVGRLQEKLKVAPSTLSHHIKSLVSVGLVSQVRESTTLVCHANYDIMQGLVDFLVAECCADEACGQTKSAA